MKLFLLLLAGAALAAGEPRTAPNDEVAVRRVSGANSSRCQQKSSPGAVEGFVSGTPSAAAPSAASGRTSPMTRGCCAAGSPLLIRRLHPSTRTPAAAGGGKMGLWSPLYYQINPSRDDEYAK